MIVVRDGPYGIDNDIYLYITHNPFGMRQEVSLADWSRRCMESKISHLIVYNGVV